MGKFVDLAGRIVGRLRVLNRVENRRGKPHYLCQCTCGNLTIVCSERLQQHTTLSCGCLCRERTSETSKIHGLSGTRIYGIWRNIRDRCRNPNCKSYYRYGGKGIDICEEWANDCVVFQVWALKSGYREDLVIDRVDNKLGYYPGNCRWTTVQVNNMNKGLIQINNASGYAGVSYMKSKGKWRARIHYRPTFGNKEVHLGLFDTKESACEARNSFILENNLPHKLQILVTTLY